MWRRLSFKFDSKYAPGKSFIITAKNNSAQNQYIQSATFNGQPFDRCWLNYSEIAAGGALDLTMGPNPNQRWGRAGN